MKHGIDLPGNPHANIAIRFNMAPLISAIASSIVYVYKTIIFVKFSQ